MLAVACVVASTTTARETELVLPEPTRDLIATLNAPRLDPRLAFDLVMDPLAMDTGPLILVDRTAPRGLSVAADTRHDLIAPAGIDRVLEIGVAPTLSDLGLHVRSSVPVDISLPIFAGIGLDPTERFGGGAGDDMRYLGTGVDVGISLGQGIDMNAGVHFHLLETPTEDPFRVIGRLGVSWRF